ncbi:uncharacterized protein LOC126846067 isoform X2 [Adelges cooleyi]|uniref:uncharacterized protein LOC126846067 isoform X2 n=1 Tax=Adelges cooleyi TaxID=133065 RepID=UPI00217FC1C0|nr:uncharacterized protein LOC126846067 isoform X2 [Adelges cooleyi]
MKHLCILISFAFVNISVAVCGEYIKQMIMTNKHIEQAGAKLPEIIERIVLYVSKYKIEDLSLMLAVPESEYVHPTRMLQCQGQMRSEVRRTIGDFEEVQRNGLISLGMARRNITREAVKTLILARIDKNRNRAVPMEYFKDSPVMCRFIGLFRSIKYPNAYIIEAKIDETETCTLKDLNGIVIRYKTSILGNIWSLNSNNQLAKPFAAELNNLELES